jgi:hypothetical protein
MTVPPDQFRRFLLRHCSPTTMERLVDPILTDVEIEAAAAAARGQQWTRRRIRIAGTIALMRALTLYGWTRLWSFREWPVEDRRAVARSMIYTCVVTIAGVAMLMLPPLVRYPVSRYQELALYLVPQAFPIALPIGLFVALLYGFGSGALSLRLRMLVTAFAIICSIASFIALAWVVPVSNQAFRVAAARDSRIPKGLPELTLGELRNSIKLDERRGRDVSRIRMTYHARWALAAAPMVMAGWALLLIARLPTRSRWLLRIIAIASCVAYASLMSTGRNAVFRETLPPIAGAWLPNAAFVAAFVLLARRTPNDERRTEAASL